MKKPFILLLLVTFLAFLLRVYQLDAASLRGDEAFTVIFVQRTWEALWKGIRFIEPNPPLLYLALRGWIALVGQSEFVTRFFSVWFGVLCVPLIYRLAREIGSSFSSHSSSAPPPGTKGTEGNQGVSFALFAAALVAINPYQIWHSQDVRNYVMWPALSLAGLIFFWRIWRAENGEVKDERGKTNLQLLITNYVFYSLATYASLMTHYYDVFIVVAENIFIALTFVAAGGLQNLKARWRTLARWGTAQIALIAAYGAWVAQTDRVTAYNEFSAEQGVQLTDMVTRTITAYALGETVPETFQQSLLPILFVILIASLVLLAWRNRAGALFAALYTAMPIAGVYIISLGRPLFSERYLNGIAPAYYLVCAFGLAALWQWRTRGRALLFAVAAIFFAALAAYSLSNYYFAPAYAKAHDWRGLMRTIADNRRAGDIVVQNFTDDAITYYRNLYLQPDPAQGQPGCNNTTGYLPVITLPKDYFARPADQERLKQLNADCQRIWFIPAAPDWWDPDHAVEKYLTRHDDLEMERTFADVQLQLFLTPHEFEPRMTKVNARVGNAMLVGYRVQGFERAQTIQAAAPVTFRLVLYWRAAQRIEKDFTVFAHLGGADETIVAQDDHVPGLGNYPTSAWETDEWIVDAHNLRVDAPSGTYTLVVGMYDPATHVRAPALDANGVRFANDRVTLTQITIGQ